MMGAERACFFMPPRKATPPIARILRSEEIYKGPVFGVRRDEVLEPGGLRAIREVITHPGSLVVLSVLPDGRTLLARKYSLVQPPFRIALADYRTASGDH